MSEAKFIGFSEQIVFYVRQLQIGLTVTYSSLCTVIRFQLKRAKKVIEKTRGQKQTNTMQDFYF